MNITKPNNNKLLNKPILIGLLVLFIGIVFCAAQWQRNQKIKKIEILLSPISGAEILNENEIQTAINRVNKKDVVGSKANELNLAAFEKTLALNPYIRKSEIFIDDNNILKIKVLVRMPVARVYKPNGQYILIDDSAKILPINFDNILPPIQIVTGLINENDSVLLVSIVKIAQYIQQDTFMNELTQQINITPTKDFEIVPLFGNHKIYFGDTSNLKIKARNLLAFYKQVLNTKGWDSYSKINISIPNQVIVQAESGTILEQVDSVYNKSIIQFNPDDESLNQSNESIDSNKINSYKPISTVKKTTTNLSQINPKPIKPKPLVKPNPVVQPKPKAILPKPKPNNQ